MTIVVAINDGYQAVISQLSGYGIDNIVLFKLYYNMPTLQIGYSLIDIKTGIQQNYSEKTTATNSPARAVSIPSAEGRVLIISYLFAPMASGGVTRALKFAKYIKEFGLCPTVLTVGHVDYFSYGVDENLYAETKDIDIRYISDYPAALEFLTDRENDDIAQLYTDLGVPSTILKNYFKKNYSGHRCFLPDNEVLWATQCIKYICNSLVVNEYDLVFTTSNPYTVGVDIFQLDGVYEDAGRLADQRKRARQIIDSYNTALAEGADSAKLRSLLVNLDRVYSECSDIGASKVAFMRFFLPNNHHVYDRRVFESYVKLPFENTTIRVPAMYGEKLRMDYGDYMNVVMSGGVHDYSVYSDQEQTLREYIGSNPFRYTLDNQKLLVSVGRYIKKLTSNSEEKPHRKIVFLPCKIGWWTSMEGLWKRVVADPDAEVHVMPLPYYDRDFEGNITNLHCDKALFPEYVHAEEPKDYDFDAERPDVVVIQVPYDATCTFMMVHPRYHSDNLQKITGEIVYVPCFEPDDPCKRATKQVLC